MGESRLRQLRSLRGLTQAELGELARTSQQQVDKLEGRGDRISAHWIERLARGLCVAPGDILSPPGAPISVPLLYTAGLHLSEGVDGAPVRRPPIEWLQPPPGLQASEDCFAVAVADDSADRLYPPGSLVIARRLDAVERPLRVGDKVVVRRFAATRAVGTVYEVLIGRLDRNAAGEITVLLRSTSRQAPGSVLVQREAPQDGLAERFAAFAAPPPDADIAYVPRGEDAADIAGVIERAITVE